jgi:hypothetical protein
MYMDRIQSTLCMPDPGNTTEYQVSHCMPNGRGILYRWTKFILCIVGFEYEVEKGPLRPQMCDGTGHWAPPWTRSSPVFQDPRSETEFRVHPPNIWPSYKYCTVYYTPSLHTRPREVMEQSLLSVCQDPGIPWTIIQSTFWMPRPGILCLAVHIAWDVLWITVPSRYAKLSTMPWQSCGTWSYLCRPSSTPCPRCTMDQGFLTVRLAVHHAQGIMRNIVPLMYAYIY